MLSQGDKQAVARHAVCMLKLQGATLLLAF
jgi:hypothetical protein